MVSERFIIHVGTVTSIDMSRTFGKRSGVSDHQDTRETSRVIIVHSTSILNNLEQSEATGVSLVPTITGGTHDIRLEDANILFDTHDTVQRESNSLIFSPLSSEGG